MATMIQPNGQRTGPRTRAAVRARQSAASDHESQYDLLTAALLGVAVGVGTTLLLRRGPSGDRPLAPVVRGAKRAGREAAHAGGRGARWAGRQGAELWERVPRDRMEQHLREYLARARDVIDDTVDSEMRDLRKLLRRERKRFGV